MGLRAKFDTGVVSHQVVLSGSAYSQDKKYSYGYRSNINTNLYSPTYTDSSAINLYLPSSNYEKYAKAGVTNLRSIALGDNLTILDDRLNIMLGARYQEIDQDIYSYGVYKYNNTKNKVTPALGLSYKLIPELSVYANYIEALVQGDGILNSQTGDYYLPSPFVSKQKELGFKYENGKIGGTLDYFYTDREKAAVNSSGSQQFSQAKNIHQGIEFNAYGQLNEQVRILGGASWIKTEQKNTYPALYDGNVVIGVP